MRSFIQTTTSSAHAIVLFILALAYTGYEAAYPYLNPHNLQWQNAVIYGGMAIISALVVGHGVASAQASKSDTRSMPTMRSPYP